MTHIAVIGAGAWGTALARLLADLESGRRPEAGLPDDQVSGRRPTGGLPDGCQRVLLWTWLPDHAEAMRRDRENREFFRGFPLSDAIVPTSDMPEALGDASLVLLVVPTHAYRETLEKMKPWLAPNVPLVSAGKGIENKTLMLMSEVVIDVLGPQAKQSSTFLSGPSFAKEVAQGIPTNVVVASSNDELCQAVQHRLATDRFRVYASDDPVGVEVGGALKNVIAIAAGACDGLGFGHNTRAALITRGLAELTRLAVAKGGNVLTLAGLAGMGDLVLTCTGELSRNRTVGFELGRGKALDDVLSSLGHVAEGVGTAKSAYHLARELDVELPICFEVYRVLYEGKAPLDGVRDVLTRPLKKEWE